METLATVVFKSFAMPENPGKYISIENGPKAVNEPNIRINLKYCFFDNSVLIMEVKIFILQR